MQFDRNGLEVLDREASLGLLATATLGRIGVTDGALPTILPVNFLFDGKRILVRTTVGTKLHAAAAGAVVAFEVDNFDPTYHSGWSVVITGTAEGGVGPRRAGPGPTGTPAPLGPDRRPRHRHRPRHRLGPADHPRPSGWRPMRPYVDVAETHSAAVFFVGDRAYKVKKPVDLGFLDFRDARGSGSGLPPRGRAQPAARARRLPRRRRRARPRRRARATTWS